MNPPPWFQAAMAECESLSLDVASDRRRLWAILREHMPVSQIQDILRHDDVAESAVISLLLESKR